MEALLSRVVACVLLHAAGVGFQAGRLKASGGELRAVRATALIKVISKSSPILDRVWAFHVRDSTPQTSIPYPSLFRSVARDHISQSKCPYAKTISKIGEDLEIALIKAVARTV